MTVVMASADSEGQLYLTYISEQEVLHPTAAQITKSHIK